jgi:hypothetical protein
MVDVPDSTTAGAGLLFVAALVLVVATESGALAVALGVAILAVAGYTALVLFGRLHDRLRHGKPMYRGSIGGGGDGDGSA